jgi:hypothetical protein
MPGDRVGNTLMSAVKLGTLPTKKISLNDAVSNQDREDLYSFKLGKPSQITWELSRLNRGAIVGFDIFTLQKTDPKSLRVFGNKPFGNLKASELKKIVTFQTRQVSTDDTTDPTLALDAGDYYLRIYSRKGNTRYSLSLLPSTIIPVPDPSKSSSPRPTPTPSPTPQTKPTPTPQPKPTPSPSTGSSPTPTPTPISLAPLLSTWIRQSGTAGNDYTYGTTTDSAGNTYVAGVNNATTGSAGTSFVAKYDRSGNQLWQRSLDLPGANTAFDVAVDNSGNYYVAGAANVSTTGSDGYIAKYADDGTQQWQKLIATTVSTIPAADAASSVAVDSAGNVYVTGFWKALPSFNQGNAFLSKYNGSDGTLISGFGKSGSVEYGGSAADAAAAVALDQDGNVYITGITNAGLVIDTHMPFTGGDAFVAKYNSGNGTQIWNSKLGTSPGQDYARGLVVDSSGGVYITGQTASSLPGNKNAGATDAFLAKYNVSDGKLQWVKQFGTSEADSSQAIAIDNTGKIYITGETAGSLFSNSFGGSDAWVASYAPDGTALAAGQLGTAADDETYGIAIDATGLVYVTGQTYGAFPGMTNQGFYDYFIAQYPVT